MLMFIPTFPNIGFLFGGMSGNFTLFGIGGLSLCSESALLCLLAWGSLVGYLFMTTVRRINCKVDSPLARQSTINEAYHADFHTDISKH